MKKTILIFLFLSNISYAFCIKDSTKFTHGISYSIFASRNTHYSYIQTLSYTLQLNRHKLSVGPSFGNSPKYDIYGNLAEKYKYDFVGFLSSYQYNFNPKNKRINVYFIYDFYYLSFNEKFKYYNNNIGYKEYKIKNTSWGFCVGNALSIKIFKGFYYNQNIGIGFLQDYFGAIPELFLFPTIDNGLDYNIILKIGFSCSF
jgi:hypothetical protein